MKPKNFPARKAARQLAADLRQKGRPGYTARECYAEDIGSGGWLDSRRAIRTKRGAA